MESALDGQLPHSPVGFSALESVWKITPLLFLLVSLVAMQNFELSSNLHLKSQN